MNQGMEDLLQEDFKAIPTRRSLMPVWVRIFISIIALEGLLGGLGLVAGLLLEEADWKAFTLAAVLFVYGISATAMITERKWAIYACFGITILVLAVLIIAEGGWIYNDLVYPNSLHILHHIILLALIFLHLAFAFKLGGIMKEWKCAVSGTKLFYE
ncbi:hypothetical protein [Chitinophaga sp. YIM B06452]|uniref:hypothetical protein n=1 Tax=Chitinophaga sp. YIM B06452 TaxID=3082158 RepID=UPI0031FF10D4